ncbi:hypothetical protein ACHWQZ_G016253 [Mnemiopsis leidyi]
MEVNDNNLQALSTYLKQTLDPNHDVRKEAEKFLASVERQQHFPILCLNLVSMESCDMSVRVAGSVYFKNMVKRLWKVDGEDKLHASDRNQVKTLIVDLMLNSPESIQRQLSDSITIIGAEDFPENWPNLISGMVEKMKTKNFNVINGVLQTAHSLFKRYRYEMRSDELFTEIKFVIENFGEPLTVLFEETLALAEQHAADVLALKVIFNSLVTIAKCFYSLNYQDLPEFFEDNMSRWFPRFLPLLKLQNKLLYTDDAEEVGLLEMLKSQVCENVALYAQKYDEEFAPFLPGYVETVWELLLSTSQEVKYDLLVSNAIKFLTSVAERPQYAELFSNEETLQNICEKVLVPNMKLRESDVELFEDNPFQYIRADVEGSDAETRRRSASDFVRALCKVKEQSVSTIFSNYLGNLIGEYTKDPVNKWIDKEAAIYIVISLAVKTKTERHGATTSNSFINLSDFYQNQIKVELTNPNCHPIVRSAAIKYIMTFRSTLPRDVTVTTIPLLAQLIGEKNIVVHSYAASAIEKIMIIKLPNFSPLTPAEVAPCFEVVLANLFSSFSVEGSAENEYLMKLLMRSVSLMKEQLPPPLVENLITALTVKLGEICKNPSKPHFNHYVFETFSCLIRGTCTGKPEKIAGFEAVLFPAFQDILQKDVTEFIPYVFQVLSLMLELQNRPIPSQYMALFPFLLSPQLWERPGSIPPLTRLIQAYVEKNPEGVKESVNSILGIFQKLIASRSNDHFGFYLLNTMVENLDRAVLQTFLKSVFSLLFQRMQSSKTTKFMKNFIVFMSLFAGKLGAQMLIEIIDSIQQGLFGMVVEKIFIAELQKIAGETERKITAVGVTKILTEGPAMLNESYVHLWAGLLNALVCMFEEGVDTSTPQDEHFIEIEDTPGYTTAFNQLVFATKKPLDPFAGSVANPKVHLAESLKKASVRYPGKLQPLIQSGIKGESINKLQEYLLSANIASLS